MKDGWLKLYYQFKDWEWYNDTNTVRLFIHLLLSANFKPLKWHGIEIPRGSLVTSRAKLASETTLTQREVRTCINRLISTKEIAIKTTNKFTVITINKYESYQGDTTESDQLNDQQNDQQTTNKRPTNDQQTTTSKESKNIRKEEYNNIREIEGVTATLPAGATASAAPKQKKQEAKTISIPFVRIKEDWNATCTAYPKLHVLSEARKNKIRNRIAEMGGLEAALSLTHLLFEKMMQSKFLRGDNKRGWKASFDWLFENDKNWVKVYEGNYDTKPDDNTPIKLNNDTQYGTSSATGQYSRAQQRNEQFARHIITKLTSTDTLEPDVSGNY